MTSPEAEPVSTGVPEALLQPVPLRTKVAYGMGMFGADMMGLAIVVHLAKFYTDIALLGATLVGTAMLVSRVWDAVTDPVVGYLSDHAKTRWGRRRPFFLLSPLPLAVAFFYMWVPPYGASQSRLMVHFMVCYVVFYTAWTLFLVPYRALGAELTLNYHEKTRIVTIRELFSLLGILLGVAVPAALIAAFDSPPVGYAGMGVVMALIGVACIMIPFFGVRESAYFQGRPAMPILESIRETLSNKPFRTLLTALFFLSTARQIPQMMVLYIAEYVVQTPKLAELYMLAYLLSAIPFLYLWVRLAERVDKKTAWLINLGINTAVSFALFFIGPGTVVYLFVCLIIGGASFGGSMALLHSIQADIIDYDEVNTGKRREGSYFGLWEFTWKLTVAVTFFIVLRTMDFAGYVPNQPQTPQAVFALKALFAFLPTGTCLLAMWVFRKYPITKDMHAHILRTLHDRHAEAAAKQASTTS